MPSLPDLPTEIILAIATTRRTKATVARTNRRLHTILNPVLYELNIRHTPPTKSCILWGARKGRLGTVKLGHRYGGNLNLDIQDAKWPESGAVKTWSGDRWHYRPECGTALQLAVRYGHPDIVAYLVEHGAEVHAPSLACCRCRNLGRLSYPLHEVVCDAPSQLRVYRNHERDKTVALMLMRHGAYLHAPAEPVLPLLVKKGTLDLVVPLLEQPGIDAGAAPGAFPWRSPLYMAAEFGRTDIAKLLLDRPEVDIDALDGPGCGVTEAAARHGHTATLRLLLERAEMSPTVAPDGGARALRAAAASGQLHVMEVLLGEYKACAPDCGMYGEAAIHLAAKGGHVDVVKALIQRPDVNPDAVTHQGMMAIHHAARDAPEDSATSIIQALADANTDVNAPTSSSRNATTALRYAIEGGRTTVALTLLSCGADPSLERGPGPRTGLTLLHHCLAPDDPYLSKAQLRLVKELIDKGADTKSTSAIVDATRLPARTDGPPLFFAAAYAKSDSCVRWLLEAGAGADFSLMNARAPAASNPQSLLMALFRHRFPSSHSSIRGPIPTRIRLSHVRPVQECIALLLKHGARLDSVCSEQSALQYACEVALEECFELLCVLLRGATRRNVSLDHVEALKTGCGPRALGSAPTEDRKKAQRRGRVLRQLSDFAARAFKKEKVGVR